jgi:signal peptidase I
VRKVVAAAVVMAVGAVVVIAAFVWQQVSYAAVVEPTDGMKPTIHRGDRIVVRRTGGETVQRGDVVMFATNGWGQELSGVSLVRRVIGIGGDTVVCCDSERRITVNGKAITEDYVELRDVDDMDLYPPYSISLPPGQLWLLSDYRGGGLGSWEFGDEPSKGFVPVADVQAIVVSVGDKDLTPVKVFTEAGLPGAPYEDSLRDTLRIVMIGGGVLFFGGIVWLIAALRSRDKPEV